MTNFAFTGTRQGLTPEQHKGLYDLVLSVLYDIDEIRHGGATGADTQFHSIVGHIGALDKVIVYPSNVDGARGALARLEGQSWRVEPAMDPLTRNKLMVALSDHLFAAPFTFHEITRSGTWSTIRYAKRTKRPITFVWPDGRRETVNP